MYRFSGKEQSSKADRRGLLPPWICLSLVSPKGMVRSIPIAPDWNLATAACLLNRGCDGRVVGHGLTVVGQIANGSLAANPMVEMPQPTTDERPPSIT